MIRNPLRWALSDPSKRLARLTLFAVVGAALILSVWLVAAKALLGV